MADVNVNAFLAEQSGLTEQEVGTVIAGVRVTGRLAQAKNADELLNTVKGITSVAAGIVCKLGVTAALAAAGYTITGSSVAGPPGVVVGAAAAAAIIAGAGLLAGACALGLTSGVEKIVRDNFGALARSLVPETIRKYYAALYPSSGEPSDELVGLIANATKNQYSLDTILNTVRDERFNPAIFAATKKAGEEKKRREAEEIRQRRALLEKAKQDAAERARKARMDRLALVYADLPTEKLEPMRKYILAGGKYTREDLVVFDAVVKKRGLKLKADGNITWPALTAGALAVGAFIVWRAKGFRRG